MRRRPVWPKGHTMKLQSTLAAVVALSMLTAGTTSFAQNGTGRTAQGDAMPQGQGANRGQANHGEANRGQINRGQVNRGQDNRRQVERGQADRGGWDDPRGARPDHNFRRGGRLPPDMRHRQYVVDDWRGHHLSAPPRGYHWVQSGSDYLLVAIATGVILQLLFNN
jgi:Ni/Co efflux regulator RcnB